MQTQKMLVPAVKFTVEELTAVYNLSRSDYMVPMQMTVCDFRRYMQLYDIDLRHSFIAVEDEEPCGIGLLALRAGQAWITRLGVVPEYRNSGVGAAIVQRLLEQADACGVKCIFLEVIEGNRKAERLFRKYNFRPRRRLLVLSRRNGIHGLSSPAGVCKRMAPGEALERLESLSGDQHWKNQARTYQNARDGEGLLCSLPGKTRGWLIFRKQPKGLSHYVFRTEEGNPQEFAKAVLAHLHRQYPEKSAHVENVCVDDPHLPALRNAGYEVRFRRLEMER